MSRKSESGISRVLHEGNLLCDEPRDVQDVGLWLLQLSLVKRVLLIDINDGSFGETLRSVLSEIIHTNRYAGFSKSHPLDNCVRCQTFDFGGFLLRFILWRGRLSFFSLLLPFGGLNVFRFLLVGLS